MATLTLDAIGPHATRPIAPPAPALMPSADSVSLTVRSAPMFRNVRLMSLLGRMAERFDSAGIPLMALKGAALNLTVYDRPDSRPMADLDVMIQPAHLDHALQLLAEMGAVRPTSDTKREFFPRFHYETELRVGSIYPVKVDLHIRPLRPLRFSATVPPGALWDDAEAVSIGNTNILIPSPADMLLHLMAHSAVHGNTRKLWLEDIGLWVIAQGRRINWQTLLDRAAAWRLSLAARQALQAAEAHFGAIVPADMRRALLSARVGWQDRLALWQAPRDARHPAAHVLVNALTTPDVRFAAAYLKAALFPGRNDHEHSRCSRFGNTAEHPEGLTGSSRGQAPRRPRTAAATPNSTLKGPDRGRTIPNDGASTPSAFPPLFRWTDRLSELRPIRRPAVRAYTLDAEAVFVDAVCGNVHQLNATAKHIWHLCDGGTSLGGIAADLSDRFDVAPDAALDQVEQVVAALGEANLLADEVGT